MVLVPGDRLLPVLSFLDPSYFLAGESIKEVQILTEYFHISQFKSKPEVEEDISLHYAHLKTQFILIEQCLSKCSFPHSEGIVIFQDHRHRIDYVKKVFSHFLVDSKYVEVSDLLPSLAASLRSGTCMEISGKVW